MAGITQEQAQQQLDQWLAALTDIATNGQSVTIGNRTFTAANLREIREQVEWWERKLNSITSGGGIRVRGAIPS